MSVKNDSKLLPPSYQSYQDDPNNLQWIKVKYLCCNNKVFGDIPDIRGAHQDFFVMELFFNAYFS